MSYTKLIILILAVLLTAPPTLAQDCDTNGIPDTAEFGPFEGSERGRGFDAFSHPKQRLLGHDIDIFRTSSFMISFWVYRSDATGDSQIWFSSATLGIPGQSLHIGFRADHTFTFAFWADDLNTQAAYPPDGQWHHWACLYDRSNNQRQIYRDGVLVAADTAQLLCDASGSFTIGGWYPDTSSANGFIDELVIYNNPNPSFVQALSTGITPPGWNFYYKFNEIHNSDSAFSQPGIGTAPEFFATQSSNPSAYKYAKDCNSNGIPDNCDIADGTSQDSNINGVPDECESDCDNDALSDTAEFGPFYPGGGGGLRFQNDSTRAIVASPDFSLANQSFSIEFWVYRDTATARSELWITSGDPGTANQSLHIGFRNNDAFTFAFWGNDLNTQDSYPPDGQWHHWACVYNQSKNSRKIYRDGVLVAQDFSVPPLAANEPLYIGGWSNGDSPSNGVIDELRFFNYPRSTQDVSNDLNTQYVDQYRVDSSLPGGLNAYYPFEPGFERCDFAGDNDLKGNSRLDFISFAKDTNSNSIPDLCEPPADLSDAHYVPHEFPTIQSAIDAAQSGDSIIIAPGIYYEQDIFVPASKQLTISGTGDPRDTVIQATSFGDSRVMYIEGPIDGSVTVIERLALKGGNNTTGLGSNRIGSGLLVNGGRVIVQDCLFQGNNAGRGTVYLDRPIDAEILRCEFIENRVGADGTAVWCFVVELKNKVAIRDCLITRNTCSGGGSLIEVHYQGGNVFIERNTIVSNFGLNATGYVVGSHFTTFGFPVYVRDNILWDHGTPDHIWIDWLPWTENNYINDPQFVDTYGWDFRPMNGSPLIDAAAYSVYPSQTDINGYPRAIDDPNTPDAGDANTHGFVADIGAFEYAPFTHDACIDDIAYFPGAPDCNENHFPDPLDFELGISTDVNNNLVPDECDADCNKNGIPDDLDINSGFSLDLDNNAIPDECEDCDNNGIPNAQDLGPFRPINGGGIRFQGGTTRASSVIDSDFTLNGESFTVEFWVYRDVATGDSEFILSSGDNFVNSELIIGFRANQHFTISFRGNDLDTPLPYPPDGQWHHWACTYDTTTNTRTIYRDGVEAASETGIADDFLGHGPLIVGGLSDSLGINGAVDELRIFDHARSQPEIVADMNTQYIDGPIPSTLHAYYPFGSHAGTDFASANDLQLTDPGDADYIVYSSDTNNDGVPDECQCPADLTGEGDLNFLDVSEFLAAFGKQDPVADFQPDGSFNFLDVSAFLAAFAAGCP